MKTKTMLFPSLESIPSIALFFISTTSLQLQRPFSIWTGRKLLQEYPNFCVGDTTLGMVIKLSDVTINSSC